MVTDMKHILSGLTSVISRMSEIRLVTSSDEHLSDQPPGSRKDDYRASILKKLEWQGELAKKVEASALIRGGDFFHHKAANKVTHATIQLAAQVHQKYHCPTYALAGNHDMSNNDPATVNRQQPLGVLFRTGVFNQLTEKRFTSGSMSVRVVGVEYTTDIDLDGIQSIVKKKDNDTYTVAVIHALASMAPTEKIQSVFNERIFDYRDLVYEGCPDVYVFGHYHKDQGIVDHLGVKFVNVGSVSRGALTFENLDRKPKSCVIRADSRGIHVEEVVIPHEDASDVFDLDLKKRLDNERKDLNDFIAKLRSNSFSDNSLDLRKQELDQFPEDLKKLAIEVLETAEEGALDELCPTICT